MMLEDPRNYLPKRPRKKKAPQSEQCVVQGDSSVTPVNEDPTDDIFEGLVPPPADPPRFPAITSWIGVAEEAPTDLPLPSVPENGSQEGESAAWANSTDQLRDNILNFDELGSQ